MNRYSIFFLFVILIFSTDVFCQVCENVQTCEELDFKYYENDCDRIDLPFIKCPFDNSKVYCPEDCSSYTLDSCNEEIGECVQCIGNKKWKYTSCINGYMLLDGNCIAELDCIGKGFTTEEKNQVIGEIEYCWNNEQKLSRYKKNGCKNGWYYTNDPITGKPTCSENTCDGYIKFVETCPHNGNCDDVCYSGTTKKVKITCNEGFYLQAGGDTVLGLEAEKVTEPQKCRKHKIGNIAFYCKESSKIELLATELANETGNTSYAKIDDNNDQIISLEPGYYDKARDYGCEAIGVVFDNDTKTKILGLKDIGYDATTGELTEQTLGFRPIVAWSNCSANDSKCNVKELDDYLPTLSPTPLYYKLLIDGSSNTDAIIAWAKAGGYIAPAAQVTRDYYPRLYFTSRGMYEEICPVTSACGKGNWYLPSIHELKKYANRFFLNTSSLLTDAYAKIEEKNNENEGENVVGFPVITEAANKLYWSSNEESNNVGVSISLTSLVKSGYSKAFTWYVRPVLVID